MARTHRQRCQACGDEDKADVEEQKVDEGKRQAAMRLAVVNRFDERVKLEIQELLDDKVDEEGGLDGVGKYDTSRDRRFKRVKP